MTANTPEAMDERAAGLDALLTQILNRRVGVEQKLWNIAAGKIPVPDADGFRALAIELGTPHAAVSESDHTTMLRLLDTAITHGHLPTWQAERRELVKQLKAKQ